jgi:hypothetical protein
VDPTRRRKHERRVLLQHRPHLGAFAGWGAGDIGYGNAIPPAAGIWHHIAFTYTGGATGHISVYVDGELNNEADKTLNIHGPAMRSRRRSFWAERWAVTRSGWALRPTTSGSRSLSKVRIHDGVLTADQVKTNYDTEKAAYLSGLLVVSEPRAKR